MKQKFEVDAYQNKKFTGSCHHASNSASNLSTGIGGSISTDQVTKFIVKQSRKRISCRFGDRQWTRSIQTGNVRNGRNKNQQSGKCLDYPNLLGSGFTTLMLK
ncbi:MAG: hypothetical protein IPN15_07070 [Saprospiraceae bacterium]|nr:hypothetical protein [Candidatus Vicinibacter affinis]